MEPEQKERITNRDINSIKEKFFKAVVIRDDAYAIQHPNGSYTRRSESLTQEIYLDEGSTVGLYNLDQDNQCTFACIDIDAKKSALNGELTPELGELLKNQARQIASVIKRKGLETLTEFSGRKGYHIWAIFNGPVSASLIRQNMALWEEDFTRVDPRIDWELFPKQDKLDAKGFGNLIKLPLQKHQVSGHRCYFVDEEFNETIPESIPVNDSNLLQTVPDQVSSRDAQSRSMPKHTPAKDGPAYPPFNLERMESSCKIVRDLHDKATNDHEMAHDERVWMGKLYKGYDQKGAEAIHEIFSSLKDYDAEITTYQLDSLKGSAPCDWRCKNNKCDAAKAAGIESPIAFGYQADPGGIEEKRGRYTRQVKQKKDWVTKIISEFIIEPHELISLENSDVLRCSVVTTSGMRHDNIYLEAEAFQSRAKLLKALGRLEATWHGSDADVQALAHYLTQRLNSRSEGIGYVGLYKDTFVAEGINITKNEISFDPKIKVYLRGGESLAKRVELKPALSHEVNKKFLEGLYEHLPLINRPEVIYPFIGWLCLVPLKSRIINLKGGFFILLVYGEQGSGKTSTGELVLVLFGYRDATVHDSRMTSFAMLSLLSSTNGLPVLLDEYKESTMPAWQSQQIKDRLRGLYRGSLEPRGHADQTVTNYKLQAPLALMGEYKIAEPAIQERVIFAPFDCGLKAKQDGSVENSDSEAKAGKPYEDHYWALRQLPLGQFAPGYIQWALGQDLESYFAAADSYLDGNKYYDQVHPRVQENWLTLYVGLRLWEEYGRYHGIEVQTVPHESIFKKQAEELGLSEESKPLRDVDKMVEYMAILVENGIAGSGKEWGWHNDGYVLISAKSMLGALRKYKRDTGGDFYIMDEASFRTQIKQAQYFYQNERAMIGGSHKRWLWLDYTNMVAGKLEVEGFKNPPKEMIY